MQTYEVSATFKSQSLTSYALSKNYFKAVAPPGPGYRIRLVFTQFNTESCCDKVYLYQGLTGPFKTSATTPPVAGSGNTIFGPTGGTTIPTPSYYSFWGDPIVASLYSEESVTRAGITFIAYLEVCPVGNFCTTATVLTTPCLAGTYNPLTGSTSIVACLSCTIGNYCPSSGMSIGTPCPIGSYCPSSGMSTPTPCPCAAGCLSTGLSIAPTCTATVTSSVTGSNTRSSSVTPTNSATSSLTPSDTASQTATLSNGASSTSTPSVTPSQSPSATPSKSSTGSNTQSPSGTITNTQSGSDSQSGTASQGSSLSQTPSYTSSITGTVTGSASDTPSSSPTPSNSNSPSTSPTITTTPSPSSAPNQCSVSVLAGQDLILSTIDAPGTNARFERPWGLLSSLDGSSLLVADALGGRIRSLTLPVAATVTTISGQTALGGADGALGVSQHASPAGFAWAADGASLFVTDSAGPTIRVLSPSTSILTTIAGTFGVFGSADGNGAAASFSSPFALALHPVSGMLYVSDTGNNCIRALVPSGAGYSASASVTTVAGLLGAGYADGRSNTQARFSGPTGLAITPVTGTFLYISDGGNNRIRVFDIAGGMITTLAGSGSPTHNDGFGLAASFSSPSHLTWDNSINPGALIVADTNTNRLRGVSLAGEVVTLAGSGELSGENGAASRAGFRGPRGIASSLSGIIYAADSLSGTIRAIRCPTLSFSPTPSLTPSTGASVSSSPTPSSAATSTPTGSGTPTGTPSATPTPSAPCSVTTFAGSVGLSGYTDAAGALARFGLVTGLAVDSNSGTVYVADSGSRRIRAVTLAGVVSTLAGNGISGVTDGTGIISQFGTTLGGLALSPNGTLFLADLTNHRIRRIEIPTAAVTTVSGAAATVTAGYVNGPPTTALFNAPEGLALDTVVWILYVSESGGHRIRAVRIDSGLTSTLAGSPTAAPVGMSGWLDTTFGFSSTNVLFNGPRGLAWAGVGKSGSSGPLLAVMDTLNNRVRLTAVVDGATGTLAGQAPPGSIVDGVGAAALLGAPAYAVGLAAAANVSGVPLFSRGPFILFTDTHRLRAVDVVTAKVVTLAGTGGIGSINGAPLTSTFSSPLGVGVDEIRGRIFVADSANFAIRLYSCAPYATVTSTPSPSIGATLTVTPTIMSSSTPTASTSPTPSSSAAGCFISILAGSGVVGNLDGIGKLAQFNQPNDVAIYGNTLYVVSEVAQTIQTIDLTTNNVTTFVGQYLVSGNVYTNPLSLLSNPRGVHIDASTNGTLYVGVAYSYNIRAVNGTTGNGVAYACSGSPFFVDNTVPTGGGCFWPDDTTTDAAGTMYFTDSNLHRIRKVTRPPGALITTLAGGGAFAYIEGVGSNSAFSDPMGIAAHPTSGWVYVSDTGNNRIRGIFAPTGQTSLLAGSGTTSLTDGIGAAAGFFSPRHMTLHPSGLALVVADRGNHAIRWVVLATGLVTTLAGGTGIGNSLGPALLAKLNSPSGVVFSPTTGIGYIADAVNHQIKAYTCSAASASPTPTATISLQASPSISSSPTRTSTQTGTPSVLPSSTPLECIVANAAGTAGWGGGGWKL